MRFRTRLPQDTATLLLVTIFVIVVIGLTIASRQGEPPHPRALDRRGILPAGRLWVLGLAVSPLRPSHRRRTAPRSVEPRSVPRSALGRRDRRCVRLGLVHRRPRSGGQSLGISKAFAGLVIVGIAGNAVEHFTSIFLAAKRRSDVAISVVKNSVAQIAAFLFPALVLISYPFATYLTFAFRPYTSAPSFVTAIAGLADHR